MHPQLSQSLLVGKAEKPIRLGNRFPIQLNQEMAGVSNM